ncbi:MAG: hypothetical protein ACKO3P_03030, partial [Planctomycetaceae bacterium]
MVPTQGPVSDVPLTPPGRGLRTSAGPWPRSEFFSRLGHHLSPRERIIRSGRYRTRHPGTIV